MAFLSSREIVIHCLAWDDASCLAGCHSVSYSLSTPISPGSLLVLALKISLGVQLCFISEYSQTFWGSHPPTFGKVLFLPTQINGISLNGITVKSCCIISNKVICDLLTACVNEKSRWWFASQAREDISSLTY